MAATSDSFAFLQTNVTQADDWQAAVDKAVQLWGKVDILVNNAGTSYNNKVRRESRLFIFIFIFLVRLELLGR